MLSNIFLGIALAGAEWVLYLLLALSIVSVALIFERLFYYREATKGLGAFRDKIRKLASESKWSDLTRYVHDRASSKAATDFETGVSSALMEQFEKGSSSLELLSECSQDSMTRTRLRWEKNLALLATIGSNAPFVGLFGTVLGIIQAFHDLSQKTGTGAQTVTAGISEALVATAVGILVAIPAVVAFNLFQRRVKLALGEAEALRSYLISQLGRSSHGQR